MRSVRTISWIWKRTVSRFSKRNVRLSPTPTRRFFLSSMTRARMASRTFSYSTRFLISDRWTFCMAERGSRPPSSVLLGQPVGLSEEARGVRGLDPPNLLDLQGGHGAVGRVRVRGRRVHLPDHLPRELQADGIELLLHPPCPVHRRAPLHH